MRPRFIRVMARDPSPRLRNTRVGVLWFEHT
uniref:Uncharacterized protein n=1 Tax=Anguilla anguilla TaxID=7936 RepID=A0A0E9TQU6_ANGAN